MRKLRGRQGPLKGESGFLKGGAPRAVPRGVAGMTLSLRTLLLVVGDLAVRPGIVVVIIALVSVVTLVPHVQASAAAWSGEDERGDEIQQTFVVVPPVGWAHQQKHCPAPSADITQASIVRDDQSIVALLSVADLSARPSCAFPVGAIQNSGHIMLWQEDALGQVLQYRVSFQLDGGGHLRCVHITVREGSAHEPTFHKSMACTSDAALGDPDTYRASVPLTGTVEFDDGFTYDYDLAAARVHVDGITETLVSGVDGPRSTGGTYWRDSISGRDVQL